jgi:hypothetical protein
MSPSTFFVTLPVTDSCDLGAFRAAFSNLRVLLANTACQPVFIFSSRRFGIPFYLDAVFNIRNLAHCLPWASEIQHREGSFLIV